jgi:hypothetical protein
LMFLSCAPAVRMQDRPGYYPEQNALLNSEDEFSDSLADPDQTNSNMGPYLKGYNDGMMTAKNESFGGCLAGGCLIGAAGVIAGLYGQEILGTIGIESNGQLSDILCLVSGITISVGSVYIANRIIGVSVPDPISKDSLYKKGFIEGYRRSYKSRRLNESMKGTAIGVGTTCAGVALAYIVLIYLVINMLRGIDI